MLRKATPPNSAGAVKSMRAMMEPDVVWLNLPLSRRTITDLRDAGLLAGPDAHDKQLIARALVRAATLGIRVSREGSNV